MAELIPYAPFRWDMARREQIGDLNDVPLPETYPGFLTELRTAAAMVLARANDSDLVFVGRSPESIFDYLSGIFADTDGQPSMTLLQFSAPYSTIEKVTQQYPKELAALLSYFEAEHVDPASIATFEKSVRFIDFVSSGGTFGQLAAMLECWSKEQQADWNVVQRRIGFVGITQRDNNSPNTWRWWQHQDWVAELTKTPIKNVSVSWPFWGYCGNTYDKVTKSHSLYRWRNTNIAHPAHDEHHLRGLKLATMLYDLGLDRDERSKFISELTAQREMRESWLRSLVLRLRGTANK